MFERLLPLSTFNHPFLGDDVLWSGLSRLLDAHAPRAGCALPGGIGDVIAQLADEQGLSAHFEPTIAQTGNAAITIGAAKPQPDILIVAHMDRPSFRVKSVETGEIYPVCALRVPVGYTCDAKAIRYDSAQKSLIVGSRGRFVYTIDGLHYHPNTGDLRWYDTIIMDAPPTRKDGIIIGTGLDNSLGVAAALGAAVLLLNDLDDLQAQNKQVMIAFTDEEEGIPDAFFGHGAARLAHHVQPTIGFILCDGHTAGDGMIPQLGQGASHGVITGMGRGSVVAPNFVRLAVDLAESVNAARPVTAQLNTGYLSRSDDMGLSRAMRVLGMIGTPMIKPHTAQEQARLSDVVQTAAWLTMFTAACLGLSPEIAHAYHL